MLRSIQKELGVRKSNPFLYLHFPHLMTGEQAYMSALILESMARALWRAYGDDMADFQGRVFPDDQSPFADIYCMPDDSEGEGDA
jgi:hypothetical protein